MAEIYTTNISHEPAPLSLGPSRYVIETLSESRETFDNPQDYARRLIKHGRLVLPDYILGHTLQVGGIIFGLQTLAGCQIIPLLQEASRNEQFLWATLTYVTGAWLHSHSENEVAKWRSQVESFKSNFPEIPVELVPRKFNPRYLLGNIHFPWTKA